MRQLLDLATLITSDPFDRTRPLWQFVLVDGLSKGRSALIEKLHHTITDGEGSVKLSLQFLDFERDAPEPPPVTADDLEVEDVPEPSSAEAVRTLLAGSLRLPIGMLRQFRHLLADPTQMPSAGAAAADTVRGILSQLSDVDQARSPLWTQRSLHRRLEVLRYPIEDAKLAAKRLGGTLNMAFITAAAHAASEYHRRSALPSSSSGPRWRSAPARVLGVERLLVGEHARAYRSDADHRALPSDPGGDDGGHGSRRARPRSRSSPPSPPPCRPRSSPGSPASRRRPSTSPRRT